MGTSLFFMPTANAAYANTTVICATSDNNQRSFQIGWDNSNQFFADKGYIPRFFCEGGYAGNYRIYVSDTLNGGALGYFNGVILTPVSSPEPSPSPSTSQDTQTASADTATATTDTSSATADTQTSTSNTDTSTQTTDTSTTTTTDSSTSTPDTPTVPAPVDGSTATSQPAPQPAPVPTPEPIVEPEPEPVVQPEPPVVEPTPEPEPTVEPEIPVVEPVVPDPVPVEEPKDEVTLPNGVVLTQEQAVAVALLQNPGELLQELFTNPAAALAAFGSVGADLSPEVRAKSEKVVISAVIAGNIATQAAASAAGLATYRRKV